MKHALRFDERAHRFCLTYGDSMRYLTLIQVWNLGVSEEAIREALINAPSTVTIGEQHEHKAAF